MAKTAEELKREFLQRESSGEFNSLEKRESVFSDAASVDLEPLEQMRAITDKVISDSKLQNSNQRETIIVSERNLNVYEAFLESIASKKGQKIKAIMSENKKVLTRCAESPEASGKHPLYFDDDSAEKRFYLHLHPGQIYGNKDEAKPKTGSVVNQTYKDSAKQKIIINSIKKEGYELKENIKIDDPNQGGGSAPLFVNGVTYIASEGSAMDYNPNPPQEIKELTEKWKPKFAPLAVGTTKYTKITVGSKFGPRPNPFGGSKPGNHGGVDMWVTGLAPIVAIDDGIVSAIKTPQSDIDDRFVAREGKPLGHATRGGAYIVLKHTSEDRSIKAYSSYCHIMKVEVKKGDRVKAGQIIAYVGGGQFGYTEPNNFYDPPAKKLYCTWPGAGGSTGVHLHFGIKIKKDGKSKRVDPLSFEYPNKTVLPDEEMIRVIKDNKKYIDLIKEKLVSHHVSLFGPLKKKR